VTNNHITEPLVYPIGNSSANSFNNTDVNYDLAIDGQPFFLANNDERPYRRVTAKYRKEQVDQTTEPGEQTLTGWWIRSQSSFHFGAGIKFFEPAQEESLRFRFAESKGVDVWTQGEITLLKDTVRVLSSANNPLIVGANDGSDDCLVAADGSELKKITLSVDTPTVTTYVQTGSPSTITALATDGNRYFFANGTDIHRGNIGGSTSDAEIYDSTDPCQVLRFVKQRLLAGINNSLFELNANSTSGALPTAHYIHPNTNWKWTAIAEGPVALYAAGVAGSSSSIFKITLNNSTANGLGFPTLNVPTVVADFPEGELVQAFDVYLGTYAVICTNKGVRVGVVGENGDISYGSLLFEGNIKAVSFRDKFAYVSTLVDGEAGLFRIDLSTPIDNTLRFPFASDVIATGETVTASNVNFLGSTGRVAFTVNGDGVWLERAATKVASGFLLTGRIRYNTLEPKVYKLIRPIVDLTFGNLIAETIDTNGVEYPVITVTQGNPVLEYITSYPTGSQEFLSYKFTLQRSTTNTAQGPVFDGYQIKALPATPKQRLIQFPVFCYDVETDSINNQTGYEGRAFDRIKLLEAIESNGDTVRVQDYQTGETFIAQVEELDFMSMTPPGMRFNGFGGLLTITVRTV
jgi:hypothetical protein